MSYINAQTVILDGQIFAPDDVAGIHILNNASSTFTISDRKGKFSLPVKENDTLVFSGISYETKMVLINSGIMNAKFLTVYLNEKVNLLDEVVVGKVLTGDLYSDLKNSGVEASLNFYDLGIPGYAGKPKTQTERRLYTAGDFKPIHLLSLLGGSLPVDPIINAISGRTKMLKKRIFFETQNKCMHDLREKQGDVLFSNYDLEEQYHGDFFYYCAEDASFEILCAKNDDLESFEFLKKKLIAYKLLVKTTSK